MVRDLCLRTPSHKIRGKVCLNWREAKYMIKTSKLDFEFEIWKALSSKHWLSKLYRKGITANANLMANKQRKKI